MYRGDRASLTWAKTTIKYSPEWIVYEPARNENKS
jgi:hypothetical protein